jgi:adenosylmethionine-8-amino-7-oxononanoate aminotransferase
VDTDYEEKYHRLMDAVKRSRIQHGDCKSGKRYNGKPLACTACMANIRIEEEIAAYKGRRIVLAAAPSETSEAKE